MKQLFVVLLNIYVNAFCEEINFSFPTDVGPVYSGLRIIGGKDVVPHTYPFVVGILLKRDNHTYFCGGTLLTRQFVLTAAHCINPKPDKIGVFLGRHNVTIKGGEIIMAQSIIVHERWNYTTVLNDIGLIKLNKNATLNENVSTVEISKTYKSYLGQVGTTLGWGKDEHSQQSHVLKSVDSKIISNKECSKTYRVSPSHLCTAGTDIRGSCQGDSGGPILVDGIQVGIVSFGALNCTAGYPSVFTRVSGYHQWIEDKIKGSGSTKVISRAVTILAASVFLFRLIMII